MSEGFSNWVDIGFFPLQDHDPEVPLGMRQQIAGGRIHSLKDPSLTEDVDDTVHVVGTEDGMGTLGDLHPWFFWQTADRDERDTGMWAGSFAGIVVEGKSAGFGTNTGRRPAGLLPIRTARGGGTADGRMKAKFPGVSDSMPFVPKGTMMLVMPGTDERNQHEIMLHTDPRIIAPNASGPGEAGTLICDLGPRDEICMGDGGPFSSGGIPGMVGRAARIQSLVRVVPFVVGGSGSFPARGNALALNFDVSGQDGLPGFGLAWTSLDKEGPSTGGGSTGPITGSGWKGPGDVVGAQSAGRGESATGYGPSSSGEGLRDGNGYEGPAEGGPEGASKGRHNADGMTVSDFGEFVPSSSSGKGLMCLSASMGGPIHGGAENDKHKLGQDRDGNPINSAHISTGANYYRSKREDGPLAFEGEYPNPGGMPLLSRVHLGWDKRTEQWRWWCEVPVCCPCDEPTDPPTTQPPTRPPTGPTTPGPTGPTTPGPAGPSSPGPRGPSGPSSPGPSGPSGPGGPLHPGPRGPRSPGPSGPGTPRGGGGYKGPITPGPHGTYPPGAGYGWRAPGSPPGPGGPTTGGGGRPLSPPPSIPFDGYGPENPDETEPAGEGGGGTPEPNGPTTGGPAPGSPQRREPPRGAGHGWRAPGSPPKGPEPGKLSPLQTNASRAEFGDEPGEVNRARQDINARNMQTVGQTATTDRSLQTLLYPMMMGFTGMAFRPQKWIAGTPSFLHNSRLDAKLLRQDESERPQVLAMHSFGATSLATGDYNYVADPHNSRARGGIGDGGIMFTPPEFEPEDYFGINSDADVDAPRTASSVMLTPGVALAFGKPGLDGSLLPKAVAIEQAAVADPTNHSLFFNQVNASGVKKSLLAMTLDQSTDEIHVVLGGNNAVHVPSGTTAQRPTTPFVGDLRVNTSGAADFVEFWDSQASAWLELWSGTSGTPASFIAQPDTPASYSAAAGYLVRVNDAVNGLQFSPDAVVDGSGRLGLGTTLPSERLEVNGNIFIKDGDKILLGTGKDAEIYYDGVNLRILPKAVGAGKLICEGSATFSEQVLVGTTSSPGLYQLGLDASAENGVITSNLGADKWAFTFRGGTNTGSGLKSYGANATELQLKDGATTTIRIRSNSATSYINTGGYFGLNTAAPSEALEVNGNIFVQDNDKHLFGTGKDAEIYYDGVDLVVDPAAVGAGNLRIVGSAETTGDLFIGDNATSPRIFRQHSAVAGAFFQVYTGGTYSLLEAKGTQTLYLDAESGDIRFRTSTGTDRLMIQNGGNVGIGTTSPGETLEVSGNIRQHDNQKHIFGSGGDAEIYYDGGNLKLKPDAVGTGAVWIDGRLRFNDNDEVRFGTSDDSTIYYDGVDLVIDPQVVGTGAVKVEGDVNVTTGNNYQASGVDGVSYDLSFVDADGNTIEITFGQGIVTAVSVSPP